MIASGQIGRLEKIDDDNTLWYERLATGWPWADRDMYLNYHFMKFPDGRQMMVDSTTRKTKLEYGKGLIRWDMQVSGMLMTPINSTTTMIESIFDGNPNGYIPAFLINRAAFRQLDHLAKVKEHIESLRENKNNL
jgi:hypothetical protein